MTQAVMIFAAGFGTRMGELTRDRPKPMIPVAGKMLIDHAIDLAAEAGITRVVANTHYLADQLHSHLAPKGVLISHEDPDILDTGGGLRAALPLLDTETVFTLNPDVLWLGPNPLTLLRTAWDPDQMDGLLMCVPLGRTHGRQGAGDFGIDETGHVIRGGDLVYGGAQILKTQGLKDIHQAAFSLNLLWDQMNAAGRLHLASYPGAWCDVGTPQGIPLAEALLENGHV